MADPVLVGKVRAYPAVKPDRQRALRKLDIAGRPACVKLLAGATLGGVAEMSAELQSLSQT